MDHTKRTGTPLDGITETLLATAHLRACGLLNDAFTQCLDALMYAGHEELAKDNPSLEDLGAAFDKIKDKHMHEIDKEVYHSMTSLPMYPRKPTSLALA